MQKRSIGVAVFLLAVVVVMPQMSIADTNEVDDTEHTVVLHFRKSVLNNWKKLSKWCGKTVQLHLEMDDLPEHTYFGFLGVDDKCSQRKHIHEKLMDVRKLLLSTDAQKIMECIDDLDERLADIDEDIRNVSENRILKLEKRQKFDQKLAKLREKRKAIEVEREAAAKVVLKELDALGLRLSGRAAEQCLFTANVGDLIDNAIVAKNIGIVVENLRELIATGDVTAAKRYFGMYVVMVEVQKACFDEYLDKSRNGQWRRRLNKIREDAKEERQKALESAQDMSYDGHLRDAFRRNAKINEATIRAVEAYEKILDSHENIIQEKANEAARMLRVAENSFKTVSLADDFLSLVKSNQDSFDALLQLQLPPIEIFDDTSLQAEFTALTKKLKE